MIKNLLKRSSYVIEAEITRFGNIANKSYNQVMKTKDVSPVTHVLTVILITPAVAISMLGSIVYAAVLFCDVICKTFYKYGKAVLKRNKII